MAALKLVLASANPGKQREFAALLAPHGIELLLQSAFGIESIEETGTTFTENALLKARHAARLTGLPALADDSGLEVDALGGAPGVRSARFAGEQASDEENNALLLQRLEAVPAPQRSARYRCVLALVRSAEDARPLLAEGQWEGRIARERSGTGGFGYDPLFLPRDQSGSAAELSAADKNALSHRGRALKALLAALPDALAR
jgi:XTP/dITP diphosphohydrolase